MPITIKDIKLYTIQETAKMLKVTPQTIRKYIGQNKIKAKKIGRPFYITEDNLKEFLTLEIGL
jgi:excisionase family DNA binding protein